MIERECRALVAERSGGMCEVRWQGVCTWTADSMHHRRKRSHGGLWDPSNILHVCGDGTRGCHGKIEANPATSRSKGYWLYSGQDPAETKVFMHFRGYAGWYSLDDFGSITALSSKALARQ